MPITYAGAKCPYCFLKIPHSQELHDQALAEHRKKNGPELPKPKDPQGEIYDRMENADLK